MTKKMEYRYFFASELRATNESDKEPMIEGYPAMFGKNSEDLGGFIERIAPGAFRRTLKNGADVRALWNHDQNYVLGRTKSGTVKLVEDGKGLRMVNRPPDTTWARDLMVSIGREDVTQMSFGFWVVDEEWKQRKDKPPLRTLKEVELVDVSVVTFPAYPDTKVALRSLDEWRKGNDKESSDEVQRKENGFTSLEELVAELDEKELITVNDGEDMFNFRDFEQFERISEKVNELKTRSDSTQSRDEDNTDDVESSQGQEKDTEDTGTPSRPDNVMTRWNKKLRENIL